MVGGATAVVAIAVVAAVATVAILLVICCTRLGWSSSSSGSGSVGGQVPVSRLEGRPTPEDATYGTYGTIPPPAAAAAA